MKEDILVNIIRGMWQKFQRASHPIIARKATFTINSRTIDDEIHFHDYPQIWYCTRGNYTHYIRDVSYICQEGSLIVIPPGTKHDFIANDNTGCDLVSVDLLFNFFDDPHEASQLSTITHLFFNEFSDTIGFVPKYFTSLDGEDKAIADELFNDIATHNWDEPFFSYAMVQKKMYNFFSSGHFSLSESVLCSAKKFLDEKYLPVLRTIYYINLNYNLKIRKEDLISLCFLSKTEYFDLIKKVIGCTYSTYLQMIRVRRAISAISSTNNSLSYIANACGFGDVTYMEKRIKKYWPTMWLPSSLRKRFNSKKSNKSYDNIHKETTKFFTLFDK